AITVGSRPRAVASPFYCRVAAFGDLRAGPRDRRRRAGVDAGHRRRGGGAVTAGTGAAAGGGGLQPGRGAALVGRVPASARPGRLEGFDMAEGGEVMKAKRSPATDVVVVQHRLAALRLGTIKAECAQVARQSAEENTDFLGFLLRLCERELADREQRACQRRLKAAKFPQLKSLDEFDFTAQPSLNRPLIVELSRCEFIDRRESVILLGGPGTGKTHVAI